MFSNTNTALYYNAIVVLVRVVVVAVVVVVVVVVVVDVKLPNHIFFYSTIKSFKIK